MQHSREAAGRVCFTGGAVDRTSNRDGRLNIPQQPAGVRPATVEQKKVEHGIDLAVLGYLNQIPLDQTG